LIRLGDGLLAVRVLARSCGAGLVWARGLAVSARELDMG
jgi:hypothetical protein